MDTSSINSGQSIGLNTSVVVSGDASIDASARANQVASASGNGNSNASATGSETLVAGSSGNISIGGNTSSLRLSALLEGSALAESVNGAASARNGAQNPDFSVDSGNPPPARIVGLGATAPLQLLVNGSLSNGGSISGQSTIATTATSIQGEAIADTAIQSLGSNNNDLRVNGAIGAGPGGSGLLVEAFSAASTRASSVNAGTFSGATPNNVSATTILQNAALLNSQLEAGGSGTIRLQSGITSNTSASAVKSGPLGIDTDPGNNPATPNFNGSTNARDAAGVVSLSSLVSVALAPYSTGVNESPVALPPQTDFTPIPATFPASISLPPTDPDTGLVINGPNNSGRLGQSIAGINDFNGDGIDDLAVVAPEANKAYVLYGKSSGFGTGIDFNSLAASDGVTIQNININASFQGGLSPSRLSGRSQQRRLCGSSNYRRNK